VEIIECQGKEESDTKAIFELVEYIADSPQLNPPQQAKIIITYKPEFRRIEAQFATNIGTYGTLTLRRADLGGKLQLSIPGVLQRTYRRIKRYFLYRLRYLYLLFVIALVVASVLGKVSQKPNTVEAIILLVPLFFMFSDRIRDLIAALALRKVGPIEFQEQAKAPVGFTPAQIVTMLSGEFGDRLPLFSGLTQFFVPRTKTILRLMAAYGRALTINEFNDLAKMVGVPEENLAATREALVSSGCVTLGDNMVTVQPLGLQFLAFEDKLIQLYRGAS
jgi:hypothetical protein